MLLFIGEASVASQCRNYSPREPDCQFYQCLEEKHSCGEEGYPLSYGYLYCDRFSKLNTPENVHFAGLELSPRGMVWRDHTLVCLQDRLRISMLNDELNSCEAVKRVGFDTHAECYTSGPVPICELTSMDFLTISTIVKAGDIFQVNSFRQIGQVLKSCGDQLIDQYLKLSYMQEKTERNAWMKANLEGNSVKTVELLYYPSEEDLHILEQKEELLRKIQILQDLEEWNE
jgi:hypothetical protein